MELEDTTNLVEADDTPEADGTEGFETGVEQEADSGDEPETDDDGNPIEREEPEEEFEEVERGDKKYKVPKALASELLMQADYTRKTQELADARKAFDAERGSVQQADAAELNARGQLASFDQQIAEYNGFDWDAYFDNDPLEAPRLWARFQTLQQRRADLDGRISQHVTQRDLQTKRETAKRIEAGSAVLASAIKEWSPEYAATLKAAAVKEYGFEPGEIDEDFGADHRMVQVLHDAYKYRGLLAKQAKAAKLAKGQEVAPVQTLRGTSGRAPVNGSTRDFAAFEGLANKASK